ncbi:unnamed protein product, partial [Didymodactylos carnosus]
TRVISVAVIESLGLTTKNVICLILTRPANFIFKASDFILLNIPNIKMWQYRPFSITSPPEQQDTIALHISVDDDWTGESTRNCLGSCLTYYCQRISIGNYFREVSGHRGLFWFGAISQLASLIGAIFIYLLTSVFNEFQERDVCKHYVC